MEVKFLPKEIIEQEIAQMFIETVKSNPNCVLGLATGSSPVGVYKKIINAVEAGEVSFKGVTSFNLDEYVGLDGTHDQSYRYFMNVNLFDHIDIDKNNTNVPNGINYEESVRDYDNQIAAKGGIDLQILGLGSDGHIAFNEPNTPFDSLTHVTELTEMTIQDNSRFFASIDEVPTKAITMGLQSIMNAKKIVLLATGKSKANAVRELLHGEISEEYPCTILQKHPNVVIYVDEEIEL